MIGFVAIAGCYYLTNFSDVVYHTHLIRILLIVIAGISVLLNLMPPDVLKSLVRFLLKPFVRSGSFSYALYIIHWPMIMLSVFIYKKYSNMSIFQMIIIVSVNLIVIFLLSWYLEERLQPSIAKALNRWYYKRGKEA